MRIASLLPSATEIVCAVGAGSALVGRSHECDFPAPEVADIAVLTESMAFGQGSDTINTDVRSAMEQAIAIYSVDHAGLRAANPDVIVTQDLCAVCALPASAVEEAAAAVVDHPVDLIRLSPRCIDDLMNDIVRVGEAAGYSGGARDAVSDLRARLQRVTERAALRDSTPTVLTVEWLDPVMAGGLWTPELVNIAGGDALEATTGELARTLSAQQLAELDPDVVVFKPCGYTLAHSARELTLITSLLPRHWSACLAGRVFVVDGNAYFNRSGPRLVDSTELLAGLLHPTLFADFLQQFAPAVRRLGASATLECLM